MQYDTNSEVLTQTEYIWFKCLYKIKNAFGVVQNSVRYYILANMELWRIMAMQRKLMKPDYKTQKI